MDPERRCSSERDVSAAGTSRRQILTASGLLAVGAISGCLDGLASATTNVGASPAAPFGGIGEYTGPSPTGDPIVYKLSPTLSADSGLLSGEVELEAWVTAQAIAANYNNSRSNKSTIRRPGDSDSDADGVDDTVEIRSKALELEKQLLSQAKAAGGGISKRSKRTGPYIADMDDTIRDTQATLERCSDDVCVTVRDHAGRRLELAQQAAEHVENGEWDHAAEAVGEVQATAERDVDLLESSSKDTTSEQALSSPRLQELTGAIDEDVEALYEYLAGEPVISEQFTVTVPDARLPRGDLALVDELTPRHLIEYVTGRAEHNGHVYAWGSNAVDKESGGGSSSPIYEGEAVGGESAIHRGSIMNSGDDEESPLYKPASFLSYISGPVDTGGHLEVVVAAGTVTVQQVNDPPRTSERTPAIEVSPDGESVSPADFDDWEVLDQPGATTSTLVCPLMVAPPDCPIPFPALLYVRRCKHDDQYIYTGGWIIDDGFLYENSITVLTADGPAEVIGVSDGDFDGDGYGDAATSRIDRLGGRRTRRRRRRRGGRLFEGTVSDAIEEGVVPDTDADCDDDDCSVPPGEEESYDHLLRKRPGRTKAQEGDDDGPPVVVCQSGHLSAPIIHFTGTNDSDNVKFKAGAELSKSVN